MPLFCCGCRWCMCLMSGVLYAANVHHLARWSFIFFCFWLISVFLHRLIQLHHPPPSIHPSIHPPIHLHIHDTHAFWRMHSKLYKIPRKFVFSALLSFSHQKLIAASMKLWFHLFILALIFCEVFFISWLFMSVCFCFVSSNTKIGHLKNWCCWLASVFGQIQKLGRKKCAKKTRTNEHANNNSSFTVIRNVRRGKTIDVLKHVNSINV